jgi:hypothetical protein
MSPENDDFERRVKSDLRRIVGDTSPEVRARISEMAAAAAREKPRPNYWSRRALYPLGGVAAVAVVVVAAQMLKPAVEVPARPAAISADDVALLLNVDNLDLLEQMEFYLWLDREPGVLDAESAPQPEPPRRS